MRRSHRWCLLTAILVSISLLVLPRPAATDVGPPQHPHFPKPTLLAPNVAFWKQVYTEYGVGDFVLHDRDRLDVTYGVVRIKDGTSQARAAELAKPEIQRMRTIYKDILTRLADGATPDTLGPEGVGAAEEWGCPCAPETLRRAAENIRVQQGLREKVDEGLHRASKLLPRMLAILRQHQVPAELAALPLVESTFNPAAYSKAGAAGLWQFIRSTGKQYSLISRKRDDRRDPVRATEAAARLLRDNYQALGSWPLAIVAYNHGHAGIRAASTLVGSTAIEDIVARYNGPRFGFASKNFYAEFLAALDVFHPLLAGHGTPARGEGPPAKRSTGRAPRPAAAGSRARSPGASGRSRAHRGRDPDRAVHGARGTGAPDRDVWTARGSAGCRSTGHRRGDRCRGHQPRAANGRVLGLARHATSRRRRPVSARDGAS